MAGDAVVTIAVPTSVLREVTHAAKHHLTRYRGRMNNEKAAWKLRQHAVKVERLKAFLEAVGEQVGDIKYTGPDR